jgi:TRAP-type C4-dicarboxylate transport system permease small subunit
MQALIGLSRLLARINVAALTVGLWLGALCLFVMVVVILIQVFFRYVLGSALAWPEEASRFLMLWSAGLMIGTAYRRGGFVAIEMLIVLLPRLVRHVLTLTLLGLAMTILWKAFQIGLGEVTGIAGRFGTDSLSIPLSLDFQTWFRVPKSWQMASMLVGIGALLVISVELVLREVISLLGGGRDLPEISDRVVLGNE